MVKTASKTENKTEVAEHVENHDSIATKDSLSQKTLISENSKVEDSSSESQLEVDLSTPDSVGKQYPTKMIYTNKSNMIVGIINKMQNAQINESHKSNEISSLKKDSVSKSDTTIKTETKKDILPNWLYWVIFISIILLIASCYFIYKYKTEIFKI